MFQQLLVAVGLLALGAQAICPEVTVVFKPSWEQINASSLPQVSKHGMEDGIVVRRQDGGLTMLAAETYSDPYAVAMQLGIHYYSYSVVFNFVPF